MGLFTAMEEEAISTTNAEDENEITVYAKIGKPEGLQQNDGGEEHTDYTAKFNKDGCKARVRIITTGETTKNYFTIKVSAKEKINKAIATSKEHTIEVDDTFVQAFGMVSKDPLVKNRYKFNSKDVVVSYKEDGLDKTIKLDNLVYEVDVFKNNPEYCKIDLEIDDLLKALNYKELTDKEIKIEVKVSHLPFQPLDVFSEFTGDTDKIEEFWKAAAKGVKEE